MVSRLTPKIRPELVAPKPPTSIFEGAERQGVIRARKPVDIPSLIGENLATQQQVDLLRKLLDAGTLQEKGFTRDIFLSSFQAKQIGYDIASNEWMRLEPTLPGEAPTFSIVTAEGIEAPQLLPMEFEEEILEELVPEDVEADTLLEEIVAQGKTPENIALLTEAGLSEEEIGEVFIFADIQEEGQDYIYTSEETDPATGQPISVRRMGTLKPDGIVWVNDNVVGLVALSTGDFFSIKEIKRLSMPSDDEARQIMRDANVPEGEIGKIIEMSHLDLTTEEWLQEFRKINPSLWKTVGLSTVNRAAISGIGGTIRSAGGVAAWAKQEKMSENLIELGDFLGSSAPPMVPYTTLTETVLNPNFWATSGTQMISGSMTMMLPLIVVTTAALPVAGVIGLGAVGTTIFVVLTGGGIGALGEAALESGGAYNEAIDMGKSPEDASKIAGSVYWQNVLLLIGTNLLQLGAIFTGNPAAVFGVLATKGLVKGAIVGGKIVGGGLTELGQETSQSMITDHAFGREFEWDDEAKMIALLSFVTGGAFVGAGSLFVKIQNGARDKFTPEQIEVFQKRRQELVDEGLTPEGADLRALDFVVESDQDAMAKLEETIKEVDREESLKRIQPADEIEAAAFEHIKRQEGITEPTIEPEAVPTPVVEPVVGAEEIRPERLIVNNTIQTQSGRSIPVPPRIRLETSRKAKIDIAKVDAWLVEQGRAEANAKGDEFVSLQFEQMNPKRLSPADKDILNDYLFGEANPVFTRVVAPTPVVEPVVGVEVTAEVIPIGEIPTLETWDAMVVAEKIKVVERLGLSSRLGAAPFSEFISAVRELPKPPAVEEVRVTPTISQAFDDWNAGRAYIDNAGNYRVRAEGRVSGPIAPWNKEVKRAFANVAEFSSAAQQRITPEVVEEPITMAEVPIEELPPTPVEEIAKLPPEARAEAELKANREKMHDAVTKPREEGEIPRGTVRHPSHYRGIEDFNLEVKKEFLTSIAESPLDTAAVAYLKTGDFADYLETMPEVSELKLQTLGEDVKANRNELVELRGFFNSEIERLEAQGLPERGLITAYRKEIAGLQRDAKFTDKLIKQIEKLPTQPLTIEDATSLGIALRRTRGGKLLPLIRRSGFYVTTEFAESPHLQDVPYTSGFWQDIDSLFEHIDGGRAAGTPDSPVVAQKYMQRPANRNFLAYKKFLDIYFLRAQENFERFGLVGRISKEKWNDIFQTVQEVTAAEADFKTAQVLRKPAIQELLSKYDKQTQSNIVEFSQWTRVFLDEMVGMQNQARDKRGQEAIGFIEKYLPWVVERNIWSTLGFAKRTPSQMHAKAPAPDFIHPDAPFNPRAMAREGGMGAYPLEKNVHKLLFDYVRTAGKDIFFTNTVQNNKIHIAALRSMKFDQTATLLEEYNAEVWAGAKPRITKAFEAFFTKRVSQALYRLRRQLTRNVFPLNWQWSLTIQPSSIAFTVGRTGAVNTIKGLDFLFMPSANNFARDTYTYIIKSQRAGKMAFQDIGAEVEKSLRWEGSTIEKAENYAGFMINVMEKLLTGISIRAGYHYGKSLGFTGEELVEYASKMGAKTQSMYNFQNQPAVLRAKPVGALLPFQTFTIQAMNFTREMAGVNVWKAGAFQTVSAKSAEGQATISRRLKLTAQFILIMMVINMVIEKLTNRKPWILSSFIPMVALLDMGLESSNPWNLLLPHKYISEFNTGFKQAIQYEDFTKLKKWFMVYHFPFGGSQINRMMDGIEAVIKGKVEDVRGTELFEVRQDEWLKAIFMGIYQTEGGREYIDRLQERKGKWYEYTGIPINLKRVDINDEIDKNLALLGGTDEDGMLYDFGDFVSDLREIRRAVGAKRFSISVSPFIDGFKKAEASREEIENLPPKKLKNMDEDDIADFIFPEADPEKEEVTALWTEFNSLKTKEERMAFIAEFIKTHADELKDNIVAQNFSLLEDMELLTGKDLAAFLEKHTDLTKDWRPEWRKDSPEDDARLSMWGYGGKIQTPEAFEFIRGWSEELGIDLDHIPTWLPPKGSEENYFEFIKEMNERSWNSWEAQLILAKDDALREVLGYDPIETPIASLELKVKNRQLTDERKELETDEERETWDKAHPEWLDDQERIEAYENNGEDFVDPWVERGRIGREFGFGSSEAMVWALDNLDAYDWAIANDLLKDNKEELLEREPVIRISVAMAKLDEDSPEFATLKRRKEGFTKGLTGDLVDQFVEYWELPVKGYKQERYLIAHPELAEALGKDISEKIPNEKIDALLEIENPSPQEKLQIKAYEKFVPDQHIDNYVEYYSLEKPEGQDRWYEDDWFLVEHPDFYKEVYIGILGNKRKDYRGTREPPTREVFAQWLEYKQLTSRFARDQYRLDNTDMDEWGVRVGIWTTTMTEKRRRLSITPQERLGEDVEERLERLRGLAEPLEVR